jgi:hypothetical protein
VGRLMLALLILFSGASLALLAGQSAQTAAISRRDDLTEVKKLHYMASIAIADGQRTLDDPLPPQANHDFKTKIINTAEGTKHTGTYRELMVRSEEILVQSGSRVTVSVEAQPHGCSVSYRAIAGGGIMDFGVTRTEHRVEPRTYEFTCDCKSPSKLHKIVDCTEDQNVQFECQK